MKRISTRLKFFISIIPLLVIMGIVSMGLSLISQQNILLVNARESVERNGEFIITVLSRIMAEGEVSLVISTIGDLQKLQSIEQLTIYRSDGRAAFSDYEPIDARDNAQNDENPPPQILPFFYEGPLFQQAVDTGLPQMQENIKKRELEFFLPLPATLDCGGCPITDGHFIIYHRVSLDNVFGQLTNGTIVLFITLFSFILIINIAILIFMKRNFIHPLHSFATVLQTVGQGNLEITSELSINAEFVALSNQLNSMISSLKDKHQQDMIDHGIATVRKENQKYLNNIGESLLFINSDRKISSLYSQSLTQMFATEDIAGKTLSEFLYPEEPAGGTIPSEIEEFLDVVFGSPVSNDQEIVAALNPLQKKEFFIDGADGQKRIVIDCTFRHISEDDGASVMVIFSDCTTVEEIHENLANERQKNNQELLLIEAVLKVDQHSFSKFIEESRKIIKGLSGLPADRNIFIADLNSVKEFAQKLDFAKIGEIIHNIEHEISVNPESILLQNLSADLIRVVGKIEHIKQRFAEVAVASASPTLTDFRNLVESTAAELSAELKKTVKISIRSNTQHLPAVQRLHSSLFHLLRNAFEHGIEEPAERDEVGKDSFGKVEFVFSKQQDGYKIIIADDGRGINFATVEQQARNLGLLHGEATREDLIRVIFSPRFITAGTEVGQREGLYSVQKSVQELGGKISVYTEEGKGTHVTIILPEGSGQ